MSPTEYAEQLYRYATGWLGWADAQAMRTSIHRIELALAGKVDFVKKTNPWRTSDEGAGSAQPTSGKGPPMKDGQLDRVAVAARMEKALALFG